MRTRVKQRAPCFSSLRPSFLLLSHAVRPVCLVPVILTCPAGTLGDVTIPRPHRQIRSHHPHPDLPPLARASRLLLRVVAETLLAAQFLCDLRKGRRELSRVLRTIKLAARLFRQCAQVAPRPFVIGAGKAPLSAAEKKITGAGIVPTCSRATVTSTKANNQFIGARRNLLNGPLSCRAES
jgi:hypothetical protein